MRRVLVVHRTRCVCVKTVTLNGRADCVPAAHPSIGSDMRRVVAVDMPEGVLHPRQDRPQGVSCAIQQSGRVRTATSQGPGRMDVHSKRSWLRCPRLHACVPADALTQQPRCCNLASITSPSSISSSSGVCSRWSRAPSKRNTMSPNAPPSTLQAGARDKSR